MFQGFASKSISVACVWRHNDWWKTYHHSSSLPSNAQHYCKYVHDFEIFFWQISFAIEFIFALGLCDGRRFSGVQEWIRYQATSTDREFRGSSELWRRNSGQWYCAYTSEKMDSAQARKLLDNLTFSFFYRLMHPSKLRLISVPFSVRCKHQKSDKHVMPLDGAQQIS